jgi:hypothetical protein
MGCRGIVDELYKVLVLSVFEKNTMGRKKKCVNTRSEYRRVKNTVRLVASIILQVEATRSKKVKQL